MDNITLRPVTRRDVSRIRDWLNDTKISDSWLGRYSYGDPIHLAYNPRSIDNISQEKWESIFNDPKHIIYSIYDLEDLHVGEIHIAIDQDLGDAQVSILIADTSKWHQGLGTASIHAVLKLSFGELGLYRVWIDIPEFNQPAIDMFDKIGFIHEGSLRKRRPHLGARSDIVIMGLLESEYNPK